MATCCVNTFLNLYQDTLFTNCTHMNAENDFEKYCYVLLCVQLLLQCLKLVIIRYFYSNFSETPLK